MARPPCDKNIQLTIEQLKGKNPGWKAPRIQGELFLKFGKQTPSSSYIRNKLKAIRDAGGKASPLDRPWSLASVTTHPVPYNLLPWFSWLVEHFRKTGGLLTIRDALWIGRLSVLPSQDKDPDRRKGETEKQREQRLNRYLFKLTETSLRYEAYEKGCERTGLTPVDSSQFDGSSLDQIYENFNRYYNGDWVYPDPWVDKPIVEAWIRLSKDGVIPR